MFGLDHILSPVPAEDFLGKYKGERALHVPGTVDKFPDLFAWEQINDQINFSRPSRESIRLIYEKQPLDSRHLAKLAEWMVKGATLVINSVQQIDPIVSRFSTSLGRDMNAGINVNCYASYPSKQGFDCHYDGHDVFVIHTAGRKSWKVFEPTRKYPLDIDTIPKGDPPDVDPYLECEMQVGDVLYIPRGHWHHAVAIEPSVHLTVSYNQRSGIDFLLWLVEQLRNNDEFLRRDFPVAGIELLGGNKADDAFLQHVDKFRERIREIIDDENLTESFLHFSMIKNPVPRNFQLPELALMKDAVRPDTVFKMTADQKILARYDETNDSGQLIIRGHILNLNNVGREILQALAGGNDDSPITGERLQRLNPKASWDDVKAMLVFLFENGILDVVPDNSSV
ncbi:MAG: cupin domain-containing protein [Arenicellales bacterium]